MKRTAALFLAVLLCLLLSGCDLFTVTTDELLSPPLPTGNYYPISLAFKKAAPQEYVLKFPTAGENRSAIITEDIDGDKTEEAFVFYATSEDDVLSMHVNFIRKGNKEWKSVAETSVIASDVEKVDFCDLNGDGKKELLIGWEVYGSSEKKLGVYSLENNKINELFLSKYTSYISCDLESNGKNEIFIQYLDQKELSNQAAVYSFQNGSFTQISGCLMDGTVKNVNKIELNELSNGRTAVFIDETKGLGAVTEVLFIQNGELVNPLLDTGKFENVITLRGLNIKSTDINGDGRLEIPTAVEMPSVDSGEEQFYYTNWCSFDGENMTVESVSYFNTSDGYYLNLNENTVGKIAIEKDSKNKQRTFYLYDSETKTVGKKLFSVYSMEKRTFEEKKKKETDLFLLKSTNSTVFAGSVNETAGDISIDRKQLKEMFKIIN